MKYFVAGTFDCFHVGHQHLLWTAAREASSITIIIARDQTVEKIKNKKPLHDELSRLARVQDECFQNAEILLGREDFDFLQTLQDAAPDVLFLGYDQRIDEEKIKKHFPDLILRRAIPYYPEFFKSSKFRIEV